MSRPAYAGVPYHTIPSSALHLPDAYFLTFLIQIHLNATRLVTCLASKIDHTYVISLVHSIFVIKVETDTFRVKRRLYALGLFLGLSGDVLQLEA